eukprot:5104946-Pyramimonas_sp.AAC.1
MEFVTCPLAPQEYDLAMACVVAAQQSAAEDSPLSSSSSSSPPLPSSFGPSQLGGDSIAEFIAMDSAMCV